MANHLLCDNWTFQCAGELLAKGLFGDTASELLVDSEKAGFSYRDRSADVINTLALFQLLNHLVLVDELYVDGDFTKTWQEYEMLTPLSEQHLVIPKPFRSIIEEWLPARDRFVEELCVCQSMRDLHARNVAQWNSDRTNEDGYFSQLIWGGAGMLARADTLQIPYAAHPLRENWFSRIDALFAERSAKNRLQSFISEQRVKVLNRVDRNGYLARLTLPPLAAIAVQESRTPSDLILIGLQLRKEYAPLREWLRDFQSALNCEDTGNLLAREKLLQSVARHIAAVCSDSAVGDTSLQIGLSWLKATVKIGSPLNSLKNRFGVRAALNRLILSPSGTSVLKKLRKIFGENHSRVGMDFERDYLAEQQKGTENLKECD